MKNLILVGAATAVLAACGTQQNGEPDAGTDTTCGLDCALQERYGLIINRCFEYEDDAQKGVFAIGVSATRVLELEGKQVIEVVYNTFGQDRMRDYFFFENGDLRLARRVWPPSATVTYRDEAGALLGVPMVTGDIETRGQFREEDAYADFSGSALVEIGWVVSKTTPTSAEAGAPAGPFPSAMALLYNETQIQRMDVRRTFVPGTGFSSISTTLQSQTSTAPPVYRLLRMRDVGTQAGGSHACGFEQ